MFSSLHSCPQLAASSDFLSLWPPPDVMTSLSTHCRTTDSTHELARHHAATNHMRTRADVMHCRRDVTPLRWRQMVDVETVMTGILDAYPAVRFHRMPVLIVLASCFFLLGLPLVCQVTQRRHRVVTSRQRLTYCCRRADDTRLAARVSLCNSGFRVSACLGVECRWHDVFRVVVRIRGVQIHVPRLTVFN